MYERTWSRNGASLPMPKGAAEAERRMERALRMAKVAGEMFANCRKHADAGDEDARRIVRFIEEGVQ
jgi:hypothetical protein